MSRRDRTWWRNIRNGARVTVLLKGKTIPAFAEAELDQEAVERDLLTYVRQIPMAARSLGIRMQNQLPNEEDLKRAAKDGLVVKVRLDPI